VSANPYLPIIILFAIGFGFAAFSVGIAAITGPARYNRASKRRTSAESNHHHKLSKADAFQ